MCSICLGKMKRKVLTECKHEFCRKCILLWMSSNNYKNLNCPICRKLFSPEWYDRLKWGLPSARVTRYSKAKERVYNALDKCYIPGMGVVAYDVEKMYNIALKISTEKIMFTGDPRFKRIFNFTMSTMAKEYEEDKFLLLIKN